MFSSEGQLLLCTTSMTDDTTTSYYTVHIQFISNTRHTASVKAHSDQYTTNILVNNTKYALNLCNGKGIAYN